MKNSKYTKFAVIIMVILFVIVSMLGCAVHNSHSNSHSHSHHKSKKVPPGQAKKISGHKSAKSHAPGQQKR